MNQRKMLKDAFREAMQLQNFRVGDTIDQIEI